MAGHDGHQDRPAKQQTGRILGRTRQDGDLCRPDRHRDPHLPVPALQHSRRPRWRTRCWSAIICSSRNSPTATAAIPFPSAAGRSATVMHGRFMARDPQRGDVIVFKFPQRQFHRLHQAADRPAGRPHPDEQRRALSQRQAGAARCASPIMSRPSDGEDDHCAAVSRDPAGRQKLSRCWTAIPTGRWTIPTSMSCRPAIIS